VSDNTETQRKLLETLKELDPELKTTWNDKLKIITHLSGALTQPSEEEPKKIALNFLRKNQSLFGIEDIGKEITFKRLKTDEYGWHHVVLQQQFQQVPVWNGVIQVHIDNAGVVQTVSSKYLPGIKIETAPKIDPQKAVEVSWEDAKLKDPIEPEMPPYKVIYQYKGRIHLAWVFTIHGWDFSLDGTTREPASWEYFIDARKGTVITRFNLVRYQATTGKGLSVSNPSRLNETTKTLQTYYDSTKKTYLLKDTTRTADKVDILTYDANGALNDSGSISEDANNDWNDKSGLNSTDHNKRIDYQPAEVDAHDHVAKVYDYYKTKFGRISIDNNFKGQGTAIDLKSYVHMRAQDAAKNTIAWNNASYYNNLLHFGDGDGIDMTYYSGALDIVAHELTHGVADYEITDPMGQPHGFTNQDESGAVSEFFSDIFAAFIEGDWKQGDKIVVGSLAGLPGKQWRDLSNPTRGIYDPNDTHTDIWNKGCPQPDHYDDRFQGSWDNGGVHINNGILNFAAYLAIHGGISHHPGRTPAPVDIPVYRSDRQGLGVERAEQILYLTLTGYFLDSPGIGDNSDVTMHEMRTNVLSACSQLEKDKKHGIDECDIKTLRTAFYAVGLHPTGENYGPDPMIIPWGVCTGSGPFHKSPDIWVEDTAGNNVNAEKGVANRLFGQVRNIGDQNAKDVKLRFSYSPFGMGYPHKDFKQIDEKTFDLAAGEVKKVEVSWDLSDLNEDHGGLWPYPIDKFDHFCVKVEVICDASEDVNTCNNMAQSNFVDVPVAEKPSNAGASMIIANPSEDSTSEVKLTVDTTLPKGWKVWFDKITIGEYFALKPDEKRIVHCYIEIPDEPLIQEPIDGHITAFLKGLIPGEIDGRLNEAVYLPQAGKSFQGIISGSIRAKKSGRFNGHIEGQILDEKTGAFAAKTRLIVVDSKTERPFELSGFLRGHLNPERRVSISEHVNGERVGGVDLNLRLEQAISRSTGKHPAIPTGNKVQEASVPISALEKIADTHAYEVWGEQTARGPPFPVVDEKGDVNAYVFPYILGSDRFPEYTEIFDSVKRSTSKPDQISEMRSQMGRFGSIYISATRMTFPILRVTHSLHPFFLSGQIAQENAEDHLKSKDVRLRRIYFLGPHEEYFEFASNQRNILIHVNSLEIKKPEDVLTCEPVKTTIPPKVRKQIEKSWERALEPIPEGIDGDEVSTTHTKKLIPHWELIPAVNWTCWCEPTALTMVLGFWNNYVKSKGTILGYGRLIDYWLEHVQFCKPDYTDANPIRNVPNLIDEIIDPQTGSWSGPWENVTNNLDKYNFSSKEVKADQSNDWAWNDLKKEIDNGRPLKWSNSNHSMTAFGYRITSSGQKFVILYNTYGSTSQQQLAEWNYAQCTGIQCIYPGGGTNGDHAIIISPDGGETVKSLVPSEIVWFVWGNKIEKTSLSFSPDGGKNWSTIAKDLKTKPGWNSHVWLPGQITNKARIKIQAYTSNKELIAGDGSQTNFKIETAILKNVAGKITLLRVHDLGTGYGPITDFLDSEVIVRLDTAPDTALGFQLRHGAFLAERKQMLSVLQQALENTKKIAICYVEKGPKTGNILRVYIEQ
jgi:bacillolysin